MQGLTRQHLVPVSIVRWGGGVRLLRDCEGHIQEAPALIEPLLAMTIAEQPVVADAMEAGRQDVQQEATDELLGREDHALLGVAVTVVSPAEGDVSVLDVEQAIVRDRHAMRVSSDVIENLLRPRKRRFGIDHPLLLSEGVQIPMESLPFSQWLEGGEELEVTTREGLTEQFQEAPTEEAREHPHGQEERGSAGDPALPIGGESAARHHAMQVRVVHQVLPPGMQDGEEADLRAEMLRVGGNRAQSLGGGGEQ